MAIEHLAEYLTAAKTVIEIFKGIKSELPQGPETEKTQEQIERAEKALRAAEAQLAKELGYNLCKCTFPPEIMLSEKMHERYNIEIFKCRSCGKEHPNEAYFRQLDTEEALVNQDADWIRARE